ALGAHGDHVKVATGVRDPLAFLRLAQARDLVAEARGALVILRGRRGIHALDERCDDLLVAALEEQQRVVDVTSVVFARHEPDARGRAPFDLVLETRAAAAREVVVLAVAQLEQLLQVLNRLAYGG